MSKYKYFIVEILVLTFFLIGCSYQTGSDASQIKKTIESLYKAQYDAYLTMEYKDITPYLDMDKVQNQNKVSALKKLTSRLKYMNEKAYGYVEKKRFPVAFNYEDITMNADNATVVLQLELDNKQAYPPFICTGDNVYELKKYNGIWKITSHDYEEIKMYEISIDQKIPELDIEELKKQIDIEFK